MHCPWICLLLVSSVTTAAIIKNIPESDHISDSYLQGAEQPDAGPDLSWEELSPGGDHREDLLRQLIKSHPNMIDESGEEENKRAFNPWNGKRAFRPWNGKRKFNPWSGKRSFSSWKGKRDGSMEAENTYSIDQAEDQPGEADDKRAFNPWNGKRAFNPWNGKRAFNPWNGKRAFNPWNGKRAFNPWGGKRSDDQTAEYADKRQFTPWGGKRANFTPWGGKRMDPEQQDRYLEARK